ncbi:hypothetical protein AC579_5439 [Pseudocercospora musae]|uniref:Probable endonuclease LCL3 n=1 Tax=Pseudocercospora musae TaxID=113226 RepID=A0A139HJE4_9PEZI|nr:hypothetical protein AC579_5439 [Pseudocercospora musae]
MTLFGGGNGTDTSRLTWTTNEVITISTISVIASYTASRFYKTRLRRIPNVSHLKPEWLRKRSLYGKVTSVGDGDNFRMFHTPGGKWTAWGFLRPIPKDNRKLKDQTLSIRIAGIDAPENPHFGRPGQEYGPEALQWLRDRILGRYVRVLPYRRDQYERVVATVYKRKWLGLRREDIGLEMLRAGLATLYEAKMYREFGGKKTKYEEAENRAKERKVGMWSEPSVMKRIMSGSKKKEVETPREFKTRMKEEEEQAGGKG